MCTRGRVASSASNAASTPAAALSLVLLLLLSACVATIDTGVKHVLLLLWLLLLQAAEACTAFGDQKAHAQGTKPKRARRSADDEPGMLRGCTMQRDQQRLALALALVRLCSRSLLLCEISSRDAR